VPSDAGSFSRGATGTDLQILAAGVQGGERETQERSETQSQLYALGRVYRGRLRGGEPVWGNQRMPVQILFHGPAESGRGGDQRGLVRRGSESGMVGSMSVQASITQRDLVYHLYAPVGLHANGQSVVERSGDARRRSDRCRTSGGERCKRARNIFSNSSSCSREFSGSDPGTHCQRANRLLSFVRESVSTWQLG
jgi:hypothetical protein